MLSTEWTIVEKCPTDKYGNTSFTILKIGIISFKVYNTFREWSKPKQRQSKPAVGYITRSLSLKNFHYIQKLWRTSSDIKKVTQLGETWRYLVTQFLRTLWSRKFTVIVQPSVSIIWVTTNAWWGLNVSVRCWMLKSNFKANAELSKDKE